MEIFCGKCQYAISSEESKMNFIGTQERNGNLELLIECPECGHTNKIYTKKNKY